MRVPRRRTPDRFPGNTASRRRSFCTSLEARFEKLAQPAQLLVAQILIGNEMRHQELGRALEYFVDEAAQRVAAGGLALDQRVVAMRTALAGVCDVTLLLEGTQDRQDGRVCELIGESLTHFGDGSVADVPEDAHYVQLAIGEGNPHASFLLL